MGFVDLVMFAVKYFDILAWSLLALVYPLRASIRAIEEDDSTSSDFKKLVAYWVLFSLIFLFEQAFHNLLLCLPFWLYLKLVITCWLVIPNFDGALYAYKHLVCPCLSIDIKALVNKFNSRMDSFSKSSDFENEVKRYVKENGLEALEKLVAIKLSHSEPNVVQKDEKTVRVAEQTNEEVSASEQVKFVPHFLQEISLTGPDINQTENKKPDADLTVSEKAVAVGESFEPEQVQKEWTCAICLLTVENETILNSHLQSNRHKAACEEIKIKTQQYKNKASTAPDIKFECREPNVVQKEVKTVQVAEKIKEVSTNEQKVNLTGHDISQTGKFVPPHLRKKVSPTKHDISQAEKFVPKLPQKVSLTGHDISQKGKYVPRHLRKVSVTGPDISQTEKFVPPHLLQKTENKKPDTDLMSSEKAEAVGACFEIPVPKQVQKEWTCAICQLTTQCETTLNSHLQGKRHKAACEAHNKDPTIQKPAPEVKEQPVQKRS
ncbi:hypothetical protein Q3G72_029290 [Acer saccharum]|nr:hypothetical protein Q3G72_029290 [Acer saccharum]